MRLPSSKESVGGLVRYVIRCLRDNRSVATSHIVHVGDVNRYGVISQHLGRDLTGAYLADLALDHGAEYRQVFRITGTVAVLVYGISEIPASIWKGAAWLSTGKFIFDGIVYGLVTAGTFGWLWPDAI